LSDGTIERSGIDVMHFTFQNAFLTDVPSLYHPHDLQHLHLPEMFSSREREDREVLYQAFCRQAALVPVSSAWTRDDVIRQYGLPEDVVHVVPLAPPNAGYPIPTQEDIDEVKARLRLPERFIFYPAQTWEHKNHIGLLHALASLRDTAGLTVPLVCSGYKTPHFQKIDRVLETKALRNQVRFVGFIEPLELQCLYQLSTAVVIPTKFEAASFPLYEAFWAGKPSACSSATSLPEQAGDAALVFDPDQPEQIAAAIERLWTDDSLCTSLVEKGHERVKAFSWEKTARIFRAHYRRIGGRELTAEDRELLEEPVAV
jgi:glycosyltransferase involved in cell wall biosynthesis